MTSPYEITKACQKQFEEAMRLREEMSSPLLSLAKKQAEMIDSMQQSRGQLVLSLLKANELITRRMIPPTEMARMIESIQPTINENLLTLSRSSLSAQAMMLRFSQQIESMQIPNFNLVPSMALLKSFESFTERLDLTSFSASLSMAAGTETYLQTTVISTFTEEFEESEEAQEFDEFAQTVAIETRDSIQDGLVHIKGKLTGLWNGARQAAESNNEDKIRQSLTSLRELTTQVLHILAPDDAVKSWSPDPNHFHKNKPTRNARLAFITAELDSPEFSGLLKADAKCLTELFNIFQKGTHEIGFSIKDSQLKAMICRAEAFLYFLIKISIERSG